jgi:hypothetical protein
VHALRRKGGWSAVNRAWDNPPVTSEQVLHVDKWEAHEPALAVADPPMHSLGAGWATADSDTYGELGTRLAFEEWIGAADAKAHAAGWGGDRGMLVHNGSVYAFAWRMRFDAAHPKEDAYAARAWGALAPALESKVGGGHPAMHDTTPFLCIERAELGPLAVARRGRDLIFIAGPANVDKRAWSSAAHCAQARAWVDEIATPAAPGR